MLIVAIPKSASTSLMKTLGYLHDIPASQTFCKDFPYPSTKLLHRYHSDIRELNDEFVNQITNDKKICKQHIAPTTNNLGLISNIKKVILLRDPEQIIEAYYRAEIIKSHEPRQEFKHCKTLEQWKQTARQNGLFNDLVWFYDKWTEESKSNPEMNLLINYSDLILNSKETINLIEQYFELPISTDVKLLKERYSRNSLAIQLFRQIKAKVKKYLKV